MELSPLSHRQIDRRLQEIDQQIHSALRDIRRNLQELEKAAGGPDAAARKRSPTSGEEFSAVLDRALGDEKAK